jgi:hypothetical protein
MISPFGLEKNVLLKMLRRIADEDGTWKGMQGKQKLSYCTENAWRCQEDAAKAWYIQKDTG